jgi:hypothetical protein
MDATAAPPPISGVHHHNSLAIKNQLFLLRVTDSSPRIHIDRYGHAHLMSSDGHDHELQQRAQGPRAPKLRGYPTFAEFIARDGDAAIFRTYKSLSARNLYIFKASFTNWRDDFRNSTVKMPRARALKLKARRSCGDITTLMRTRERLSIENFKRRFERS